MTVGSQDGRTVGPQHTMLPPLQACLSTSYTYGAPHSSTYGAPHSSASHVPYRTPPYRYDHMAGSSEAPALYYKLQEDRGEDKERDLLFFFAGG